MRKNQQKFLSLNKKCFEFSQFPVKFAVISSFSDFNQQEYNLTLISDEWLIKVREFYQIESRSFIFSCSLRIIFALENKGFVCMGRYKQPKVSFQRKPRSSEERPRRSKLRPDLESTENFARNLSPQASAVTSWYTLIRIF